MSHHRRGVTASGAPPAQGPYSQAVVAGGLVFCSGQIPLDPATGELVDGSVGDQVERCLESLAAVCEAAGAKLADAVRMTVYSTDLGSDWAEINGAYGAFFDEAGGGEPPARAAIGVAELPRGARVEIDAVVALPE
jgi:2-iminobutanoate/2-iminopropanoate deaminase